MSDSRISSFRLLIKFYQPKIPNRVFFFLFSMLVAWGASFLGSDPSFTELQSFTLFLIVFAVMLWVTEAVPPFAVSILIIGFMVYAQMILSDKAEAEDVQKYVNTWSSPVIWLMLGGFFMAKGMEKVGLDRNLFSVTVQIFGTRPKWLLLGLMLTTALGSMVMSNTATTAMMIASVTPLLSKLEDRKGFRLSLLLGIPAAASVGGMGTIIGSPPNAIAVGALSSIGIEVDFVEWMKYGFPLAILLTVFFWWILTLSYKIGNQNVGLEGMTAIFVNKGKMENWIVIGVLMVTISLWMTSPIHGFKVAGVAGLPIVVLTLTGIISHEDVRGLPWDTLMLVAGGLSLGIAIVDTGLADFYISKFELLTNSLSVLTLLIVIGIMTAIFSNIMSNTATSSILIPVAMIALKDQPMLAAIVIGLSASTALFLPISTPPNAIAYSTGYLAQKDFRLGGLILGLLGPVLAALWVYFL